MRRCYVDLLSRNQHLVATQGIRNTNYVELMDCLKQINLYVQDASRCRGIFSLLSLLLTITNTFNIVTKHFFYSFFSGKIPGGCDSVKQISNKSCGFWSSYKNMVTRGRQQEQLFVIVIWRLIPLRKRPMVTWIGKRRAFVFARVLGCYIPSSFLLVLSRNFTSFPKPVYWNLVLLIKNDWELSCMRTFLYFGGADNRVVSLFTLQQVCFKSLLFCCPLPFHVVYFAVRESCHFPSVSSFWRQSLLFVIAILSSETILPCLYDSSI